jgi:chromosome segregation ATPase
MSTTFDQILETRFVASGNCLALDSYHLFPYRPLSMWRPALIFFLVPFFGRLAAAGPDDDYIGIYQLIQSADAARDLGRITAAREAYTDAQTRLKEMKKAYPDWNERVVAYRLRYIAEKLSGLPADSPEPPAAAAPTNPAPVLAPSGEVIDQFNELNRKIGILAREKAGLEARLREALSAQPAPIDPKEFQRAVDSITSLQTTNKLLVAKIERQEAERRNLVDKVVADEAQAALRDATKKLRAEHDAEERLAREKAEVEAALKKLRDGDLHQLQAENSTLKQQVSQLKTDTDKGRQVAELTARLAGLQTRLDEAAKERTLWAEERNKLTKQLEDLKAQQQEDGILKVRKLETELAVAKADANREAARAEELATELVAGKAALGDSQAQNKVLGERVAALGEELAAAKAAEVDLRKERAARSEVEERLKAAETRLAAVNAASKAAPDGEPSAEDRKRADMLQAQVAALTEEATQLRESLAESRKREGELAGLLDEASTKQAAWAVEKRELVKKLSIADRGAAGAKADADVRLKLEARIGELEKERDQLAARLSEARNGISRQIAIFKGLHSATPRERAMEFRMSR